MRRRDDKRKNAERGEKEKKLCERSGWGGILTVLRSRNSSLQSTKNVNVAIFNMESSAVFMTRNVHAAK